MQIKDVHVIFHVLVTWFIQKSVGKHLLVAYWGQNSAGMKYPQNPEKELKEVCQQRKYDIIVIGFVVKFFSTNNKDEMPEVNFSNHCWVAVSTEYPNLYGCPNIEEGIKVCQRMGKKVLISLGGATGNNDLQDAKAKVLARNLWDLFLGGKGRPNIRPFGSAILDGIDLDIEDHKSGGYAQLVQSLRELEKTAGPKKYLMTGAPQCPFPDASLGPKPGTALGDQGAQFNHVYVQFYNNFCQTGDPAKFYPNMDKWLQFAANAKQANDWVMVLKRGIGTGPNIFVGMPAAPGGAGDPKYYRTPDEVATIYEKLKNKPDFGGFMLWDASWDQQNIINGKLYSDHIAELLGGGASPTTPSGTTTPAVSPTPGGSSPTTSSGTTTPGASPTPGTSKTTASPMVPTTTPATEGGGGADFCKGKQNGNYADPNNPSGYISCVWGTTSKRACPPGLMWNKEKKICDWPPSRDAKTIHRPVKQALPDQLPIKPVHPDQLPVKPVHPDQLPVKPGQQLDQPHGVQIQNRIKGIMRVFK